MPDAEESKIFWSSTIWTEASENGEKKLNRVRRQETLLITIAMIEKQIWWMSNWKAPRQYGIQDYWSEPIKVIKPTLIAQLHETLESSNVLKGLTTGTDSKWLTILLVKDRKMVTK